MISKFNYIKKFLFICVLLIFCVSFFPAYSNNVTVYATGDDLEIEEPEDITFEGYEVGAELIRDSYLYKELKNLAKNIYGSGVGSTLYSDMFKDVTEITFNNKNITSLEGLDYLEFDNLTTLVLSNNKIETIVVENFETMPNLKILDLSSNKINTIDIKELTILENINLNNNLLTEINLEDIVSTSLTVGLANNKFSSMADIKLPIGMCNISLNILLNNIFEIADDYFQVSNINIQAGIQGFKPVETKESEELLDVKINTKQNLKVYKIGIPNAEIRIYSVGQDSQPVKIIKDSDITENYVAVSLGVGNYKYVYAVDNEEINVKVNKTYSYLPSQTFSVIPSGTRHIYEHKGKTYETLDKVTGKVKVYLYNDDEGEIYYKVNSGEWIKGTEVECNEGGSYAIRTKVVKDGLESEESLIIVKTSLNSVIPDGLMLALLLFFAVVLFFVVVPVVSKKFFKK